MYLSQDQINHLFSHLKETLSHFVITFDYFPQTVIDQIKENARENSNESLWKSGIEDINVNVGIKDDLVLQNHSPLRGWLKCFAFRRREDARNPRRGRERCAPTASGIIAIRDVWNSFIVSGSISAGAILSNSIRRAR